MKTPSIKFQLLIEQANSLYATQKEIGSKIPELLANTIELYLVEGLLLEAEENKRQCERLEGLIDVLCHNSYHIQEKDDQEQVFYQQSSIILKRIIYKHTTFGYRTTILAAKKLGKYEIVELLEQALDHHLVSVEA